MSRLAGVLVHTSILILRTLLSVYLLLYQKYPAGGQSEYLAGDSCAKHSGFIRSCTSAI